MTIVPRFSIKTALLAVTFLVLGVTIAHQRAERERADRRAVRALKRAHDVQQRLTYRMWSFEYPADDDSGHNLVKWFTSRELAIKAQEDYLQQCADAGVAPSRTRIDAADINVATIGRVADWLNGNRYCRNTCRRRSLRY